jgi:hypothetical protein
MKRLILTVAVMLAVSTPVFAQNTEQERCGDGCRDLHDCAAALQPDHTGRRRGMTISEIERHGFTWEQVVYREKPTIRQFLKENPVYEKATNNDRVAVRTVCNDARAMVGKKK